MKNYRISNLSAVFSGVPERERANVALGSRQEPAIARVVIDDTPELRKIVDEIGALIQPQTNEPTRFGGYPENDTTRFHIGLGATKLTAVAKDNGWLTPQVFQQDISGVRVSLELEIKVTEIGENAVINGVTQPADRNMVSVDYRITSNVAKNSMADVVADQIAGAIKKGGLATLLGGMMSNSASATPVSTASAPQATVDADTLQQLQNGMPDTTGLAPNKAEQAVVAYIAKVEAEHGTHYADALREGISA